MPPNPRPRSVTRHLVMMTSALAVLTGCGSLVDVDTPAAITNDRLNPARDGHIFSLSARENFAIMYGQFILYGAWFTGEAVSTETQPAVAEFDERSVSADNGDLLRLWTTLSVARETAERVVSGLSGTTGAQANVDLARAALFAGYSYTFMAEYFCQGTTTGGPLLQPTDALHRAEDYFALAERTGDAATSVGSAGDRAEAHNIGVAALVGSARARLQDGDRTGALADAQRVPADFMLYLWYSDDPGNLARLANTLWFHTALRGTLGVAPAFRNLNDSRVPVAPPAAELPPFDGVTPFWTQRKYAGYASSIPLASGMEARYIAAEAQGNAAMLVLINERRLANGASTYSGPADDASVTRELMIQRSREFFLEGKRLGDARRHPGLVPDLPEPGTAYHKPGFPPIGDQLCWPLPTKETSRFTP